ncbi:MAG TPA: DoxX family protein [Bryobacteraceae bacterium]|nr:DoxX family protein [Bryobacteraceae bacterium]
MLVLAVLLVAWLSFRAAGAAGINSLANWRDSGRWALALMLLFTASAHFTSMRHDLARMVPESVPYPEAVVLLTGILEVAGAFGLVLRLTREVAGGCLCLLFIAMFTANVKAAREGLAIGGSPATELVLRVPMQVLFIWLAWWSTRSRAGRDRSLQRH